MQVTDSARVPALARTLSSYPAALMRGHGDVVVGSSINRRSSMRPTWISMPGCRRRRLLLSRDIVTMNEPVLFKPEEFDINRPWEHLKQETLDDAARAKIDRSQFRLDQTQAKQ